ncbi:Thioesterase/thiol ester dehydrase-isomerase [Peniophora sp. CONT]|nr:Thioesterase/thiol ester dehydrase-isomerase [Peniophora sp. CONT]
MFTSTSKPPTTASISDAERSLLDIPGNAPPESKASLAGMMGAIFGIRDGYRDGFALDVARRLALTEVTVRAKEEEESRKEWRVVFETTVEPDMVNAGGSMHGGCSAYLVDICTSLALAAAGKPGTVSQAIDMVYHAPAPLGCRIRIVNLTITLGARVSSARCEIWDTDNKRLIATGLHMKMSPSPGASKL